MGLLCMKLRSRDRKRMILWFDFKASEVEMYEEELEVPHMPARPTSSVLYSSCCEHGGLKRCFFRIVQRRWPVHSFMIQRRSMHRVHDCGPSWVRQR